MLWINNSKNIWRLMLHLYLKPGSDITTVIKYSTILSLLTNLTNDYVLSVTPTLITIMATR